MKSSSGINPKEKKTKLALVDLSIPDHNFHIPFHKPSAIQNLLQSNSKQSHKKTKNFATQRHFVSVFFNFYMYIYRKVYFWKTITILVPPAGRRSIASGHRSKGGTRCSQVAWLTHLKLLTSERLPCPTCAKPFLTQYLLNQHLKAKRACWENAEAAL